MSDGGAGTATSGGESQSAVRPVASRAKVLARDKMKTCLFRSARPMSMDAAAVYSKRVGDADRVVKLIAAEVWPMTAVSGSNEVRNEPMEAMTVSACRSAQFENVMEKVMSLPDPCIKRETFQTPRTPPNL